jgi:diguanylate cyclase
MGRITFSAGVVALPGAAAEVEAAIARADALLYQAKEGGRDLVLSA